MIDLVGMLAFDKSPLELILRTSVMWWFIFGVIRFLLRRNVGEVGPADVLLLVLVADAAQNAMADEYNSLTSGLIVVGTLFFWNWFLDYASVTWKWGEKLMEPHPIVLVKNGRYNHRAMKRERISKADVQAEVRKAGFENVTEVKWVRYESDGDFSVVGKKQYRRTSSTGPG